MVKRMVRRLLRSATRAPSWRATLNRLKEQGFEPKTIFDIGVATGTPDLYAAFPNAFYYFIDPSRESVPYMNSLRDKMKGRMFNVALSDKAGEVTLNVPGHHHYGGSSTARTFETGWSYKVIAKRLDQLVPTFWPPVLCKIDVQGAAVSVLRGATDILDRMDVLIVETNTLTPAGDDVAGVISILNAYGFSLYDIADINRRPLDNAIGQVDLVFVKRDSHFRKDVRWSNQERRSGYDCVDKGLDSELGVRFALRVSLSRYLREWFGYRHRTG